MKSEMQVDSFEPTEDVQLLRETTARTGELQKAPIGAIWRQERKAEVKGGRVCCVERWVLEHKGMRPHGW
jgi:hypothetical protein